MKLRRIFLFQVFLYFLLRISFCIFSCLGFRTSIEIAKTLARCLKSLDAKHTMIIQDNLKNAFKQINPEEIKRITNEVWENLCIGIIELALLARYFRGNLDKDIVELRDTHYLEEVLSKKKGGIIVLGHLGNWEITGLALAKAGFPLCSVARPLDNVFISRYLDNIRSITGQNIIVKFDAASDMFKVLRNNKLLAILIDQNVRRGGVLVDFFGRKASTVKSPAILSLRTGAPIIPIEIYREIRHSSTKQIGIFHKPIYPDSFSHTKDKVLAITQEITGKIEEFIRRHPGQWFWFHKRWHIHSQR